MNPNTQIALQSLFDSIDYTPASTSTITITESPTALASAMPLADMASAVMAAQAAVVSDIYHQRSGQPQHATIDRRAASLAMASNNYLRVDGEPVNSWDPLTGYYRTADRQWVYCHTNFAHHRDALLSLLGVPNDRDAMVNAIAKWPADTLEDTSLNAGCCVTRLRTREQWQSHTQYSALQVDPVIKLTRIDDSAPIGWPTSQCDRALSGVRMLDLSRVIAGPMVGRTLAEHGASVLLVSGPHLPSIEALVIDTGPGKLSAQLDLRTNKELDQLQQLLSDADVFLNGFRPGALSQFGLSPSALTASHTGLICLSISAFSDVGPWSGRRGYDTLVQATTGLAVDHGNGEPERLPCQPLDYITGYLCAFGAMVALLKRAEQGGSWHVELSLARTANWLWQMSDCMQPELNPPTRNPNLSEALALCYERDTPFGRVNALSPVIQLSDTPGRFELPPVPLGTHQAVWP